MNEKEIIQLFEWTIDEYGYIKSQNIKEKYGYFMAIMDIFGQLINYQKESTND